MASQVESILPDSGFGDLKQEAMLCSSAASQSLAPAIDLNSSVGTDHIMEGACDPAAAAPSVEAAPPPSAAAVASDEGIVCPLNQDGQHVLPSDEQHQQQVETDECDGDESAVDQSNGTAAPLAHSARLPETRAPCDPLQLQLVNELLAGSPVDASIVQPPRRLALPLPRDGFMCDQCGDRFVLPSSLAQHMSRRVMDIFYSCPECKKTCFLSNKCQFLEHLDSHGTDPEHLEPSLVEARPLKSSDLCTPTKVFPSSEDSLLMGPPKLVQMAQLDRVDKPVHVSCPVCNVLSTTTTLASHLCPHVSGTTLETAPPRCPHCAQPCPTECCLVAHQGLHKPNLWPYPYVCPECGVKVLGSFDDYRQHVVVECLHLTRDLKSCCAVCLMEVGDVSAHMLHTHVQKLYKCRLCPLAFESISGFTGHVRAKHDEQQTFGGADGGHDACMTIFKCPFCSATFNSGKTLREHMAGPRHGPRVLEQVKFVFRCPACDLDYDRKQLLFDHLERSHPNFSPTLPAVEDTVAPGPAGAYGGPAADSPATPASGRGRGRGRQSRHSRAAAAAAAGHTCCVCQSQFAHKMDLVEHAAVHLREGAPLCLLCNVSFADEQRLKVHIAEHACEIGRDRCGLCYLRLGSRDALQHHLETEHNLRDFTCQICHLVFARLAELNRHTTSKHSVARPGRPPKRHHESPPPLSSAKLEHCANSNSSDQQQQDDDELPLSVSQARAKSAPGSGAATPSTSARRGTLPSVTSLYELDEGCMAAPGTDSLGAVMASPRQVNRRGRPRGGNTAAAVRASAAALKLQQQQSAAVAPPADDELPFVEQPAPPLPSSGYRCVHCGWESGERAAFAAHVRRHRSSAAQHQCLECGQCYATGASLRKHLLLVHKVRPAAPPPVDAETERWRQLHQAPGPRRDTETLEQIAQFVATSGAAGAELVDADEEEGDEQVIELEMKEGEITQKQLRARVTVSRPGDSSDDEEEQPLQGGTPAVDTNGQ